MVSKLSVVIGHRNKDYLQGFCNNIYENFPEIDIVETVDSGAELISAIIKNTPDIIISDLILVGMDALTAIDSIKSIEFKTKIILTTDFMSSPIANKAMSLGVSYFLLTPFDMNYFNYILSEMTKADKSKHKYSLCSKDYKEIYEKAIKKLLAKLNFKSSTAGYRYLNFAILFCLVNDNTIDNVTKILYPETANFYETTPSNVERSIRHAINSTYEIYKNEFFDTFMFEKKPKNTEFIKNCIQYIKQTEVIE